MLLRQLLVCTFHFNLVDNLCFTLSSLDLPLRNVSVDNSFLFH